MNERHWLSLLGFVLCAVGAIALATVTSGIVVGSIVCFVWGVVLLAMSTL